MELHNQPRNLAGILAVDERDFQITFWAIQADCSTVLHCPLILAHIIPLLMALFSAMYKYPIGGKTKDLWANIIKPKIRGNFAEHILLTKKMTNYHLLKC